MKLVNTLVKKIVSFLFFYIFINMRTDILEKKEEILKWIEEGQSKSFMYKELNCRPSTFNNCLKKLGIDYKGNKGGKGIKLSPHRKTAEEYIKSTHINSDRLRRKLIEDGIKEQKCESCMLDKWLDKPISLELHHVDGDRFNNEFDNLQILCPNCHSQTDNFRAKNIKT